MFVNITIKVMVKRSNLHGLMTKLNKAITSHNDQQKVISKETQ